MMSEARCIEAWDHTAAILAKLHNVNCAKQADMIKDPSDLNPIRRLNKERRAAIQTAEQAQAETDAGIAELKLAWIRK